MCLFNLKEYDPLAESCRYKALLGEWFYTEVEIACHITGEFVKKVSWQPVFMRMLRPSNLLQQTA